MSRRPLGAVLLVAAAVGAVVGTFLPLFREGAGHDARLGFVTTAWETTTGADGIDVGLMLGVRATRYGVPITVAAAVLLVAAGTSLLPGRRAAPARGVAIGGTGLLIGSVWTTGMGVASSVASSANDSDGYVQEVREGVWVLVLASVAAVVGAVLVHARRPDPVPAGPVVHVVGGDDTDTPPHGIPVARVQVARLPESDYTPADRQP